MATCVIHPDPQTRNEAKAGFLIMKYTFMDDEHFLLLLLLLQHWKHPWFQ